MNEAITSESTKRNVLLKICGFEAFPDGTVSLKALFGISRKGPNPSEKVYTLVSLRDHSHEQIPLEQSAAWSD